MTKIESRQGRIETLPPGNKWEFSDRNKWLKPRIYHQEYQDLSQASEAVQHLARGVQEKFIQDRWYFTTVMGSDCSFAIVFCNPLRLATTQQCLSSDFLKPEALIEHSVLGKNIWLLPTEPINELLKGTNLYAYNSHGAYNNFELEGQKGLFARKPKTLIYYQSGIAFVHANLHTLQDELSIVKQNIEELKREFKTKVQPLQAHREYMRTLRTPNPRRLFDDTPQI